MPPVNPACRGCGCTVEKPCISAESGASCWWSAMDLCSSCDPDQTHAAQALAVDIAYQTMGQYGLPGCIAAVLDRHGNLQMGAAMVDDPVTDPLHVLADAMVVAIEQVVPHPSRTTVVTAHERIGCIHCLKEVAAYGDTPALREHLMTCKASPLVQEVEGLRSGLMDALQYLDSHLAQYHHHMPREELVRLRALLGGA